MIPENNESPVTNIPAFVSRDQHARWARLDLARLRKSDNQHSRRNCPESVEHRIKNSRPWAAEPSEAADVARIMNKMVAFLFHSCIFRLSLPLLMYTTSYQVSSPTRSIAKSTS